MSSNIEYNEYISLRVHKQTQRRLELDTKLFSAKSLTSLINIVLRNYYDTFKLSNFTFMKVKHVIAKHLVDIPDDKATLIVKDILKGFDNAFYKSGTLERIPFRFDNDSFGVVQEIRRNQLFKGQISDNEYTIGIFMRDLLTSYAKLSTIEREKIYFKSEYRLIESSIKSKNILRVSYNGKSLTIHPYHFIEALDDFGQYLIGYCEESKSDRLLLLRKVTHARLLGNNYLISEVKNEKIKEYSSKGIKVFDDKQIDAIKLMFNEKILKAFSQLAEKIDVEKYNNTPDEYILDLVKIASNIDDITDMNAVLIPIKTKTKK